MVFGKGISSYLFYPNVAERGRPNKPEAIYCRQIPSFSSHLEIPSLCSFLTSFFQNYIIETLSNENVTTLRSIVSSCSICDLRSPNFSFRWGLAG